MSMVARHSPMPERAIGRQGQEQRQVLLDTIADQDGLVAGLNPDVNM